MLDRSGSAQAFPRNVSNQMLKGKPKPQAQAIAYAAQGSRQKSNNFEAKRKALKSLANPFTKQRF